MASIWFERRGQKAVKLEGRISPGSIIGQFRKSVPGHCAKHCAKLLSLTDMQATMQMPDGSHALMFVEPYSPPSAPEKGQPHRALSATGGLAK